jgi:hypothetical protein
MFARKQHNMLIGKPIAEAVTIRIGSYAVRAFSVPTRRALAAEPIEEAMRAEA